MYNTPGSFLRVPADRRVRPPGRQTCRSTPRRGRRSVPLRYGVRPPRRGPSTCLLRQLPRAHQQGASEDERGPLAVMAGSSTHREARCCPSSPAESLGETVILEGSLLLHSRQQPIYDEERKCVKRSCLPRRELLPI